ncbi:helix-turn-helix transcriptional regulator [Streptomyces pharetrae]|uniref:helix-turn-helix domain-containing protein n=1 Tax=Streptomyces pharetrae TaxID=291370 RepID=UPI0033496468
MRTAPVGSPGAALGSMLESLRQRAQLTFAELAERTAALGDPALAVSAATLKRAAGGHALPKETTVVAYARGCGASPQQENRALQLWRRARAKDRGILRQLHAPGVHNIRTRQDFTAALAAVYEGAGAPPLRTVQQRAGTVAQPNGVPSEREVFLLPLGTLCRIVNRKVKLPAWNHCEAFLRGCGVTGQRTLAQWQKAWRQASTGPVTAPHGGQQPVRTKTGNAELLRRVTQAAPAGGSALDRLTHYTFTPRMRDSQLVTAFADLYQELMGPARRNGLASDTGFDAILVSGDGSVQLIQAKSNAAPTPRSDGRGERPNRAGEVWWQAPRRGPRPDRS